MIKQEILIDIAQNITLDKYANNIQLIPSSATVIIYDNEGTEITSGSCSIAADGTISFSISALLNDTLGENFRADFISIISGSNYYDTVYFDVVKKILKIQINDEDLRAEYPPIDRFGYRENGEVTTGGSSTVLYDIKSFNQNDDYFTGGELLFLSGNNIDFKSLVTDYEQATGKITLKKTPSSAMIAGDKFIIRKSFTNEINRAFERIKEFIRSKGNRPALILDDTSLREPNIYGALMLVFMAAGTDYEFQYNEYKDMYYAALNSITFNYDKTEDLIVTDDEKNESTAGARFRR